MDLLKQAIYDFGVATQYYPGNLDQLAPDYIDSIPQTAAGDDFTYTPQDGGLYHPHPEQMRSLVPRGLQERRQRLGQI